MEITSSESHGDDMKLRAGPVRRNLFGPVDHQQLQQDFQRLLGKSLDVANQRWNFDFWRDQPTQGSIEWEELRCQDVPAFYRSCVVKGADRQRAEASGEGHTVSSPAREYLEVMARETYRNQRPEWRASFPVTVKRRQATITEFYVVKKRFLQHKGPNRQ